MDLVATDVVMPPMRGSALAARLRERFPRSAGTRFLEKPYDGEALARAARTLLDA